MIGQEIGDYKILAALGEQAMGTVYLAEHKTLQQKVAIKALDQELIAREGMRERFEREAQVLARLNHPNIIRILNFYNLPEGCYIVTELPEGETLEARLQREGPVAPKQAAKWMVSVLRALSHAHSLEIIHRDLKPGNVLITQADVPKLLDFGMAQVSDGPKLTLQGMTLGTVVYMSREQLMGKSLDPRSDVYSMGVTLFEVTTGKLPFDDENEQKLMVKIMKTDPVKPTAILPDYPPELEKIILKALSKERAQRYANADEMAQALESFLRGTAAMFEVPPVETQTAPPPPPPPTSLPPPPPPSTTVPSTPTPAFPTPAPTPVPPTLPPTVPATVVPMAPPPANPLLNPLVIGGLLLLLVSVGLGLSVLLLVPESKLIAVAVLGVGLPIGLVVALVGLAQSGVLAPKS